MKNTKWLISALALSGATAIAAPFMAVGDNAELFLTGNVSVKFDDNIFLNSTNEKSDTIISVTPGFELVFGKGSATTGNIYYREEFRRFSDNDNQDTELSSVGFSSRYDNEKTKVGAAASFAQLAASDNNIRAAGTIVRRDVTNLKFDTEFGFSAKTTFGAGIVYDNTDYKPSSFTDSSSWTLPMDVYFEMSPKLSTSVGYRYRDVSLGRTATDSNEHFFSVGARGEFTPKLSGQIRVGYNQREFDVGGDQSGLGVDSSLAYAYSEKTSLQMAIGSDFSNSASGEATKVRNYSVSSRTQMTEQWNLAAGLGLRSVTYPNRSEDFVTGSLNLGYTYSNYLNFSAGYNYADNDSTAANSSFKNSSFTFTANIRY